MTLTLLALFALPVGADDCEPAPITSRYSRNPSFKLRYIAAQARLGVVRARRRPPRITAKREQSTATSSTMCVESSTMRSWASSASNR